MDRPFVLINMASSADGKITSGAREYPRMTSAYDRRNMDRLRAESDAILVGAGTMRADNPKLHVRNADMQAYRRSLGKSGGLLKVDLLPIDSDRLCVRTAQLGLHLVGAWKQNEKGDRCFRQYGGLSNHQNMDEH